MARKIETQTSRLTLEEAERAKKVADRIAQARERGNGEALDYYRGQLGDAVESRVLRLKDAWDVLQGRKPSSTG